MKGLTLGEQGEYALDTGPSILQLPGVLERIFERSGKRLEDYVTLVPRGPEHPGALLGRHAPGHLAGRGAHGARGGEVRPGQGRARCAAGWRRRREKYAHRLREVHRHARRRASATTRPGGCSPTLRFKPWQTLYRHLDELLPRRPHDLRARLPLEVPGAAPHHLLLRLQRHPVPGAGLRGVARGGRLPGAGAGDEEVRGGPGRHLPHGRAPVEQVLVEDGARGGRAAGQRRARWRRTRWW